MDITLIYLRMYYIKKWIFSSIKLFSNCIFLIVWTLAVQKKK